MELTTGDLRDQTDMMQLAAGQHQALDRLIARHGDRLFRYLLRSLQNEADAADIAQESFVRVYLYRQQFQPSARFVTWLYTIAGNLVRDRYRWRKHRGNASQSHYSHADTDTLPDELIDPHPSPHQALLSRERSNAVQAAIANLPTDLREPFILSVYENLTHFEIAQIFECSPKAVEMKIYRARKMLWQTLEKWVGGNW